MYTHNFDEGELLDKKISAEDCNMYLDQDSAIECLNLKIVLRMKKRSNIPSCSPLLESLYNITKNWDFIVLCCYVNLARVSDSERTTSMQDLLNKYNFPESHEIFLEGINLYLSRKLINFNELVKNSTLKTDAASGLGFSQELINELWSDAVLDHNILLVSKCYENMYLESLARLCLLDTKCVFDRICKLVNCGYLTASINAKDGTINFKNSNVSVFNESASTIKKCGHLVREKLAAHV